MPVKKENEIREKKPGSKVWLFITIGLVILAVIVAYIYFSKKDYLQESNIIIDSLIEGQPFLGAENASLVIVEFSDFQCPYCRQFHVDTFPYLKLEYLDTEKIQFVYKDFPLVSIHPMALPTAEIANCIFEEFGSDAFWEFNEEVYAQQNILDTGTRDGPVTKTVEYDLEDLKEWADGIGYNITSCIENRDNYFNETSLDFQEGVAANVTATPTFIFANRDTGSIGVLPGAYPFADFQKVINQMSS